MINERRALWEPRLTAGAHYERPWVRLLFTIARGQDGATATDVSRWPLSPPGFDDRDTDLFLCDTNTCKFEGECLRIGNMVTCICDFKVRPWMLVWRFFLSFAGCLCCDVVHRCWPDLRYLTSSPPTAVKLTWIKRSLMSRTALGTRTLQWWRPLTIWKGTYVCLELFSSQSLLSAVNPIPVCNCCCLRGDALICIKLTLLNLKCAAQVAGIPPLPAANVSDTLRLWLKLRMTDSRLLFDTYTAFGADAG